jgi:coenzyme F420-reducing hydrogenase beta subunit
VKNEKTCIDILGVDRCTGCFGCQTACHQGAIHLALDAEGFYKPVVNRDACNHCGLCQRRCAVLAYDAGRLPAAKWPEPKAFAAWSQDEPLRLASSSGGLFSELARPVIAAGGAVAGCVWGAGWTPQHVLARTWPDVEKMRGSKYVPSQLGDLYDKVVEHLRETSGPVLFVGTPCQIVALDLALSREQRERVLLADLICDGVPSLRVFHSYLRELFRGEPVVSYRFREKSFGWRASSVRAESASRRCHHLRCWRDSFVAGSQAYRLYMMPACHRCTFARLPRAGDITLGDFWGCPEQWNDKRGVSVALANTSPGLRALESLARSGRIVLEPVDFVTASKGNPRLLSGEYAMPESRRGFLDGIIAGKDFKTLQAQYFPKADWWSRFCGSDAKLRFIANTLLRRLGRLRKTQA